MVQILDSPKSFGSSFSNALSQTLPDALGALIERKRGQTDQENENKALKAQGINLEGVKNPKTRELLLSHHQKNQEHNFERLQHDEHVKTIKDLYGENAARLYAASTEGGKTKLQEFLLEHGARGENIDQILGNYVIQNRQDFQSGHSETPQEGEQQLPGMGRPEQNPDQGLTSSEKVARQEKRYEKNLPLYEVEDARRQGLVSEAETLDILNDLNESKKLPEGLGRLNVSYKEGNLVVPALANAETQKYIKTVNQFLNKAKDTFGARVTNFELDRFLQQLPTLANTEEGRREILKQMKYFNSIQNTYQSELQKYIDEKGGIRNVDWDAAKRRAEERARPQIEEAKKQFKNSEKIAQDLYEKKLTDVKAKTPKGSVVVEKDGQFGYIPKKNLYKATKNGGYKRV
jgi:hypothetical protein